MGNILNRKEEDPKLKKQSSIRQSIVTVALVLMILVLLVILGLSIEGALVRKDPTGTVCPSPDWQPTSYTIGSSSNSSQALQVVCEWPAGHTASRIVACGVSVFLSVVFLIKMTCRRSERKIIYMGINLLLLVQAVAWFAMGAWDAVRVNTSNVLCVTSGFTCDYHAFYPAPALAFICGLVFLFLTPVMFLYTRKNDHLRKRILVHRGEILEDPVDDGTTSKKKKKPRRKKNDIELPPMSEDDLDDLPL